MRTEDFDKYIQSLTQQRGQDYGPPLRSFRNISAMQGIVAQCPDPAVRYALNMMCVKIGRLIETPNHFDSILDIAGYARTIMMVLDERDLLAQQRQGAAPIPQAAQGPQKEVSMDPLDDDDEPFDEDDL